MFQRILVPLDGSTRAEQALPVAARLARASNGTLLLLRAFSVPVVVPSYPAMSTTMAQTTADITIEENAAREYLQGLIGKGSLEGIHTEVAVEVGQAAASILSTTETSHIDLVVICSHGYTGFKRWLLGSVAEKVAHHSPVPVLLLHEEAQPLTNLPANVSSLQSVSVLVPLDGSALAEAALAPAAQLAEALSLPDEGAIHLIRAVVLPGSGQASQGERDAIINQAQQYLDAVVARLRQEQIAGSTGQQLSISCSVTIDDDIASGIIRVAESGEKTAGTEMDGRSEIIAMTTHGLSGLQQWAIGSVTQRVLQATTLPLLIVRSSRETKQP